MYRFITGSHGVVPRVVYNRAAASDTSHYNNESSAVESGHVHSADAKVELRDVIQTDLYPLLWDEVRAFRVLFGYVEVSPGKWRRPAS